MSIIMMATYAPAARPVAGNTSLVCGVGESTTVTGATGESAGLTVGSDSTGGTAVRGSVPEAGVAVAA